MMYRFRPKHADLLFPSYVLIAAMTLWVSTKGWLGEWQWTFDSINGTTVLLGPYAASATAWRLAGADANGPLYSTTQRGWAVPIRIGAGVFGSVGLAWLLVAASGLVGTLVVVHGGPAPIWVLLASPIVLLTCISAGAAVGHQWPNRIAALLVAPTLFVLGGLGASGQLPDLLRQGMQTSSLAGSTWDSANFWLRMAALTLATTTFGFLAARDRASRKLRTFAVPFAATSAFAVALSLISSCAPQEIINSTEQPTRCTSQAPSICVAPSNARALKSLAATFDDYLSDARELGLDLPSSFREVLANHYGGGGWGQIVLDADPNNPRVSPDAVLTALVTPGDCRAYYDPLTDPPDKIHEVQVALRTLITDVHAGNRKVLHNPALLAWAQQSYRDLRDCRLTALKPPPGTP